ncbi:hypothetical protein F4777DRAFT_582802 [Nemania sp. FL0916]|nr:hypothetical protein F4777DRAFT_582802 [Nemania sp. FL0916]
MSTKPWSRTFSQISPKHNSPQLTELKHIFPASPPLRWLAPSNPQAQQVPPPSTIPILQPSATITIPITKSIPSTSTNPTKMFSRKIASSSSASSSSSSTRRLIQFFDPTIKGPDARGRTLDQILAWSDAQLERQHDYIQTVFPLPEESVFAFEVPVVDEDAMLAFRRSPELRRSVLRALRRMGAFYGFDVVEEEKGEGEGLLEGGGGGGGHNATDAAVNANANANANAHVGGSGSGNGSADADIDGSQLSITPRPDQDCEAGFKRWVTRMDHNHLRITRIIRSLRVLGLAPAARAFYAALMDVYQDRGTVGRTTIGFWTRAIENPLRIAPDGTDVPWLDKY